MLKTTPLIEQHQKAGAKLVDFAGWQMPLHYGSQMQEHRIVREDAGIFDVSHMAIVDVAGKEVVHYLRYLLANDIAKLDVNGKALYTCMLNEQGGIIDDLIVYKLADDNYRLVLNAATREKDWNWLQLQKNKFEVQLTPRNDLAMIAVQGPNAIDKVIQSLPSSEQELVRHLQPFSGVKIGDGFFSRTGYTGEDGLEIQIPSAQIVEFWERLISLGIKPCGLGARDTLRLEAGLNLYGIDMDESTTPLESNLAWTVAFDPEDRIFVGRNVLEQQKQSGKLRQLVGLILETPGVLRNHQKILIQNDGEGEITSGTFSPTLGHAIALARIPATDHAICEVEIRQKKVPVKVVRPPFVRKGKKVYKLI